MENTVQLILVFCVVSLTVIFIIIGIWIIIILREIKRFLSGMVKAGGNIESTTRFIKKKFKENASLISILTFLNDIWSQKGKIKEIFSTQERQESVHEETSNPKRRFFSKRKSP